MLGQMNVKQKYWQYLSEKKNTQIYIPVVCCAAGFWETWSN